VGFYDYIDKINLRENYCFKEKEMLGGTKNYGRMFVVLTIDLYHFWVSLVFNTMELDSYYLLYSSDVRIFISLT
jgi:hypothetical protein